MFDEMYQYQCQLTVVVSTICLFLTKSCRHYIETFSSRHKLYQYTKEMTAPNNCYFHTFWEGFLCTILYPKLLLSHFLATASLLQLPVWGCTVLGIMNCYPQSSSGTQTKDGTHKTRHKHNHTNRNQITRLSPLILISF